MSDLRKRTKSYSHQLSLRIEFEIQMKLIRLFLITLLLLPCPVCWGHGFAAMGEAAHDESETPLLAPACCSHCSHSRQVPENEPTQQHDCPCLCHVSEVVFAQTTPAVNLRGITTPLSIVVDLCCHSTQTVVSKNSNAAASSVPMTRPLRI